MHSAIQHLFDPEIEDLGGSQAHQSHTQASRNLIGPFICFDHLGPATLSPAQGVNISAHPQVNLATVTYGTATLRALQAWVALPDESEEAELTFQHYPIKALPRWETAGAKIKLITGHCYGYQSPVQTSSPTLYLDIQLKAGATFKIPADYSERAIYSLTPGMVVDGQPLKPHRLAILAAGKTVDIRADIRARTPTRCMVIGGEPVGQRAKWWNFVSSRPQRIKLAKKDWKEQRFTPIPRATEFRA